MKDDALHAPSPLWVRIVRMLGCLIVALIIGWRGAEYDSPYVSTAVPFVMCQLAAVFTALIGIVHVARSRDIGPA
jgi:hypothetical protein